MARSDDQKAVALAALAANGGDFKKTARFCGVPHQTIRRWAAGQNISPDVLRNEIEKKEALADKLERLARSLADAAFDKSDEASLQSCATSMAIAIDKMQLLREKPTSITEQYADPDARRARIDELLEQRRRSGANLPARIGEIGERATVQ